MQAWLVCETVSTRPLILMNKFQGLDRRESNDQSIKNPEWTLRILAGRPVGSVISKTHCIQNIL